MRTPDQILIDVGIDVDNLKNNNPKFYDNIRKAMDEFADQYAEWREQKKLKPCPFCGGESIAYGHREENTRLPHVSNSLLDLDGKTIPVTFHVSKYKPKIDIDLSNDC